MRKAVFISLLFICGISQAQLLPNFGGQRAGLSALSFLKNDLNPASFAMASASICNAPSFYSSENNPAALGLLPSNGFAISNMSVGAGINQSFVGTAIKLNNDGTLGFNVNSLNSGEMLVRTEFQPNGTGQTFFVNNTAVGLSYAQKLSENFNIGFNIRYVFEGMADYTNHTVTTDIGFLYTTDFKDLTFAVVIKNFGGNSQLVGNTIESSFNRPEEIRLDKYTTPTIFKMGFSLVPYQDDTKKLRVSAELNHPNDNAENIRLGAELAMRDLVFARIGYKTSVKGQNYPTFGVGIKSRLGAHPLYLDYGMNPTNRMGVQHVFGIHIPLNQSSR